MKGLAPSTLLLRACFWRTEVRSCKLRLASRLPCGENTRTWIPGCAEMAEKEFESTNSQLLTLTLFVHDSFHMSVPGYRPCSTAPILRGEERPGRAVRRQFGGRRARNVRFYCSTLQTIAAIGFYRREAAPWRGLVGVPGWGRAQD